MPEGHTLHRLARDLNSTFGGRRVQVSSPQGRFADAADLLHGTRLLGADAVGKHLFIEFDSARLVHVHLGLIGAFILYDGPPGLPVGQVRLRLATPVSYADLRGALTCELITPEQRDAITAKGGPDPLLQDQDPDRAWARISRSARTIGALLMDQHVVSGIGNVYRAEVLFRHGIDPRRPGNTLRRKQWVAMWADLVGLMSQGVESGRIDTVRPEHRPPEAMGRPPRVDDHGGEVYVYRRAGQDCLVCRTRVRTEVLEGRNLFWCPACQRRFRSRARPTS